MDIVTCLTHRVRNHKKGILYFLTSPPNQPRVSPKPKRSVVPAFHTTRKSPLEASPESRTRSQPRPRSARPRALFSQAGRVKVPQNVPHIVATPHLRAYTTEERSASTPAKQAGFQVVLLPLVSIFKSNAALHVISTITRIILTFMPLSIRARLLDLARVRYLRDPAKASPLLRRAYAISTARYAKEGASAAAAATATSSSRWNLGGALPALVLAPVLLLAATLLASLERTPVTGRWRIVMLSPAEESDLVNGLLAVGDGQSSNQQPAAPTRDWLAILRSVLDLPDEGISPTTGRRFLLGGQVLDERDWRVRWTRAVLERILEQGVPQLAVPTGSEQPRTAGGEAAG